MNTLPDFGYLRLKEVLKIFPVSRTHWYDGIKTGVYPKPDRLSDGVAAWRVADIKKLCEDKARSNDNNRQ